MTNLINSAYTALSASSHDILRQAVILGFDVIFFIFWFCAAIAVGHFSSVLNSYGLCAAERESERSVFGIGWWWNCGAAISSALFGKELKRVVASFYFFTNLYHLYLIAFVVWFAFFPTVIFSAKLMFDKVRNRKAPAATTETATSA